MSRSLFKCPYCNYSSKWKSNLTRHVRVHEDSPLTSYSANCDIQFASNENYQAHKEYYCSTRPDQESIDSSSSPTPTQQPQNQEHHPIALPNQPRSPGSSTPIVVTSESESRDFINSSSSPTPTPSSTPAAEASSASVTRMSLFFKCPYCSYSSDWPARLNRHVSGVHGDSSVEDGIADLPLTTPPLDRYSATCDIQFSLSKNYQVHKELFCSTRHVPESIDSSSSPTPTQQLQQ
ncbi:hypothetical protein CDAR_58661 [Caerostris darwini]|uniref:C2H2-type domain-containing protein n=1 Tax=Caerostris darwini TaxID=1538125 RepID=A0AAV4S2B6_9ARAC|nr:hypothetical protein CDAR_58661 [Caerostris darwini]